MSGFQLIPVPAKILAAVVLLAIVAAPSFFMGQAYPFGLTTVFAGIMGSLFAAYILLAGYVYADSKRRGMPPIPWTALAVMIPNCVGFVLYFLLRKPILHPCPHCGSGIVPNVPFCSNCGQPQASVA